MSASDRAAHIRDQQQDRGADDYANDHYDDAAMDAVMREWEFPRINAAAGIDVRWLHAFIALRIADVVAQIATGDRLHTLGPDDRAWFKAQGEQVVQDAVLRVQLQLLEGRGRDADQGSRS